MKKVLVLIMIISVVLLFCACNNTSNATTPNDIAEPTTDATINPQENVTIDWETPINIDDSFLNETSSNEDSIEDITEDITEDISEGTEPTDTNPTTGSESESTEPTVTEPVISSPTNGSGAIELPMIPG